MRNSCLFMKRGSRDTGLLVGLASSETGWGHRRRFLPRPHGKDPAPRFPARRRVQHPARVPRPRAGGQHLKNHERWWLMSPGRWESAGGGIRGGRVDSLLGGPAARPPCAELIAGCWGEPPAAPPRCTAPAPSCHAHAEQAPSTQRVLGFTAKPAAGTSSCGDIQLHPAVLLQQGRLHPWHPSAGEATAWLLVPAKSLGREAAGSSTAETGCDLCRARPSSSRESHAPCTGTSQRLRCLGQSRDGGCRLGQGGPWRPLTLLQAQDASARDGQSWHP